MFRMGAGRAFIPVSKNRNFLSGDQNIMSRDHEQENPNTRRVALTGKPKTPAAIALFRNSNTAIDSSDRRCNLVWQREVANIFQTYKSEPMR
jgi:hypothetical protein